MKTMNLTVTKLNRVTMLVAVVVMAFGLIPQASAQKYSHRPKPSRFTQQGSTNAAATAVFNGGRDLIDDAQWVKAEQAFAQYISQYPQEKNLDAALYWMAYAQSKLRKYNQSKETLQRLLNTYEKTTWREDAELLLAQLPGAVTVKVDPTTVTVEPVIVAVPPVAPVAVVVQNPVEVQARAAEVQARMAEAQERAQERVKAAQDRMAEKMAQAQEKFKDKDWKFSDFDWDNYTNFDFNYDFNYDFGGLKPGQSKAGDDPNEFKIVVLQALCQSDPQRCVSVASDWLKPNSGTSVGMRSAALKFLAQYGGKAALPTILSVAQNPTEDIKVRARAISLLGQSNDDSVLPVLRDLALNSPQTELVEPAVYALGQHNSPQALSILADVAASSRPVPLRRAVIRSIASRPGEPSVDALFKIYDSTQDLDIRKSVISGFGNRKSERAGAKLLEIARSSENIDLRKAAINAIARRGGENAVDVLMNLYDSEKSEDLKDAIMNSFGQLQDKRVTDKLISIARNPQTPIERRRRVVMLLSNGNRSKDPDVIKYFEELLRQ
jgi:HEAT repeat protein